ncbi:MAG TPA: DUF554 domain-containing protein [Acidimicrobiia bacterium]|nr:DUF554 domain-containing protein [Acidimicrobiia bacterium]
MHLPVGAIVNVAAVLAGTAIGALAGTRFPENVRTTVMATLGLATAAIGIRELLPTDQFPLVLGAVLAGALIGELIGIEAGLHRLGAILQTRLGGRSADIDVEVPERTEPAPADGRFAEGFVIASLVFCVGPLTIIGSIQDGLGDPQLLLVKSALDGFASIAFAAVYGWGVAMSALTVAVIQGGIALAAAALDGVLTDPMLQALGAAGGILLLGIALRLLDLKQVRVANMLPAVVLAPLFVWWWG